MKNVNVCFFASKHHTELHTREKNIPPSIFTARYTWMQNSHQTKFPQKEVNYLFFKFNFLLHVINTQEIYAKKKISSKKKNETD